METLYFLGIDISKKTFHAALTQDGVNMYSTEVENTPVSIKNFVEDLKKKFSLSFSQLVVCMEHTGIYCYPLLNYLVKHKVRVCVEAPLQIKQSQGMTRGKNDEVDARRIACYAYKNREELRFWKPQRLSIQKLKALLTVRERLVKAKAQLETPLNEMADFVAKTVQNEIAKSCNKAVKAIVQEIKKVEKKMKQLVKHHQQKHDQMKWVTSVPGVGSVTALNVIVATGEFERIKEAKKFACYAGVAPFEYSSGSSVRGKTKVSKLANMTLKKLLHMGAMSAIQWCEELKLFYQRKVAQGKNKMSVINAVRNKLISRIFACVKGKRTYEKIYRHALA
jgi:transposase